MISFETNTTTLSNPFDSNAYNAAVHRLSKQVDFFHGASFTFLLCWMVMGFFYSLINTFFVADNSVTSVLGFGYELLFKIELVLLK